MSAVDSLDMGWDNSRMKAEMEFVFLLSIDHYACICMYVCMYARM